MAKKRYHSDENIGFGQTSDHRRAAEAHDFNMFGHSHDEIANMPSEVKMHAWEKVHDYMAGTEDDTIHGIDKQIDHDESKVKSHLKPRKA